MSPSLGDLSFISAMNDKFLVERAFNKSYLGYFLLSNAK